MPRYDELDPKTRREVDRAIGRRSSGSTKRERQRARPSAATGPSTGEVIGSCQCGETFTNANQLDQHAKGPGHTRFSCNLRRTDEAGHGQPVASDATPQPEGEEPPA